MLQMAFFILKVVSGFLLIAGVLALLSLALSAPYLPIVVTLTSQQATSCAVSAGIGMATGAAGLAVSYFFKPTIASEGPPEAWSDGLTSFC
jgi:hypothetical protein